MNYTITNYQFRKGKASPGFRNFEPVDQHGGHYEKMCLIYEDFPSKLAFFFLISFFDQRNSPVPYPPLIRKMSICELQFVMTSGHWPHFKPHSPPLQYCQYPQPPGRWRPSRCVLDIEHDISKKMLRSRIHAKVNGIFRYCCFIFSALGEELKFVQSCWIMVAFSSVFGFSPPLKGGL